jgi:hypothetical protein
MIDKFCDNEKSIMQSWEWRPVDPLFGLWGEPTHTDGEIYSWITEVKGPSGPVNIQRTFFTGDMNIIKSWSFDVEPVRKN